MTTKYEFTFWDQFAWNIGFRNPATFPVPMSDCPETRLLNLQEAGSASVPIEWPAGWAATNVSFRGCRGDISQTGQIRGWPVQRVLPGASKVFFTKTMYNIFKTVELPRPVGGDWWVEGNPTRGGAWDKHWLGVCPETGEAWECIGMNVGARTMLDFGHWKNGELIEGRAVCRGRVSLTQRLWNRGDPNHRLALHISGDDKVASTHFEHPTVGDVFRLKPDVALAMMSPDQPPEARDIIAALGVHGAEVVDRTGATEPEVLVAVVAGSQWTGAKMPQIKIGDLELVTG